MADRPATKSKTKKPGRKRRVAGWLLLVIGVLITGVWGASRWWAFGYSHPSAKWAYGSSYGSIGFSWHSLSSNTLIGWYAYRVERGETFWKWWVGNELTPRYAGPDSTVVNAGIVHYSYWVDYLISPDSAHLGLFIIPWPFALASLLGGGWLVWSGRRARRRAVAGVCLKCGYDLAGLAAGAPCPECGAMMPVR